MLVSAEHLSIDDTVEKIFTGEPQYGSTELEAAALGYKIVKRVLDHSSTENCFLNLSAKYHQGHDYDRAFEFARNAFFEPYYEFLDENIDDKQAILKVIRDYKHRCEWFRKEKVLECAEDSRRAESRLAADLYEYLHESGVEFSIEPKSASGIPDFILDQTGQRIIADAKIFDPSNSKGKAYLISGFHQVYTYLKDFNENCGYLVIFKTCDNEINFLFPPSNSMFPHLTLNNKTIFLCVVDLANRGVSASKRGKLTSYDIKDTEFVAKIEEEATDGPKTTD